MKRLFFSFTLSLFCISITYSQEISNMNMLNTLEYLSTLTREYEIYCGKPGYIIKFYNNDTAKNKLTEKGVISIYHAHANGSGQSSIYYNIFDIRISDVVNAGSNNFRKKYSLSISCKGSECITDDKLLISNQIYYCDSETILTRLKNALIHLQYLSQNSPELKKVIDPFDTYNFSNESHQITITNIVFKDKNNNKRIDQIEECSFITYLKNHNASNASNLQLFISDINNTSGLVYNTTYDLPTIKGGQTSTIEIPIRSNQDLKIGEANFELSIKHNENLITNKNIRISTFNSGPEEFLISKLPDIDINIPKNNIVRKNTYAIIIGNEDYKSKQPVISYEANVKFAVNDAKIFKEYLTNTFGIPNTNITYLTNATSAEIKQAINKVKQLPLVNSNAEILFYYAGHGLPDEKTKEQYLIPVDVNSANLSFGIKINEIESELNSNNPKQVLLILDACFSGAARNESLLSNRAVRVRPKENLIKGNSIILSASSNEEASKAYDEMQHGMFTYAGFKSQMQLPG